MEPPKEGDSQEYVDRYWAWKSAEDEKNQRRLYFILGAAAMFLLIGLMQCDK